MAFRNMTNKEVIAYVRDLVVKNPRLSVDELCRRGLSEGVRVHARRWWCRFNSRRTNERR